MSTTPTTDDLSAELDTLDDRLQDLQAEIAIASLAEPADVAQYERYWQDLYDQYLATYQRINSPNE